MLNSYQMASGQIMTREKGNPSVGGTTRRKKAQIADQLQMVVSSFPGKYPVAVLMPGRIRKMHAWYLVKNVKRKLLNRIPIQIMCIYRWPKPVIDECERIMRNFLWSGDPEKGK